MERIAVLGGGNAGQAIAADCSLAGKEVRLFEFAEYSHLVEPIMASGKIRLFGPERNLKGFKRNGTATLDLVTTRMAEAVRGADIVAVSVRAQAYEGLFHALIPCLEDGQVIALFPDNFGSLILRRMMREQGCDKKVVIGGWSSLPYGARLTKLGDVDDVYVLYRAITLRGDALPSKDRRAFFEAMKAFPIMDTVDPVPGDTVIDIGFSNVNPILHVPATVMNVGAIDNWGVIFGDKEVFYDIYKHGFSYNLAKIQYALYREEAAVAERMGVGIQPYEKKDFFSRTSILGQEFMGPDYAVPFEEVIPSEEWMMYLPGERFTVESRYITEDIPVGCHIYYRLAEKYGLEVPVIESMIRLASVISGADYFQEGFTLDHLGIAHLGPEEMLGYLREG
jgi:opine dehydrogenase